MNVECCLQEVIYLVLNLWINRQKFEEEDFLFVFVLI